MKRPIAAIIFSLSLVMACNAQKLKPECDFSAFKPLAVSHALLKAAVKKVQPDYPAGAVSVRAGGKVSVKILVDRQGNVAEACVTEGHPLLIASAKKAAREWKFKENFGFSKASTFYKRYRFVESEIQFNFKPN